MTWAWWRPRSGTTLPDPNWGEQRTGSRWKNSSASERILLIETANFPSDLISLRALGKVPITLASPPSLFGSSGERNVEGGL